MDQDVCSVPAAIQTYMDSHCRTCLSSAGLWPLFPVPMYQQNFARALFLSTGLQIKVNDGLPQKICRVCASTVEDAMRFRLQSQAVEKRLLQYCKNKTDEPTNTASVDIINAEEVIFKEVKLSEKNIKTDNASDNEDCITNEEWEMESFSLSSPNNEFLERDCYLESDIIEPPKKIMSEQEKELENLYNNVTEKRCTLCNKDYKSFKSLKQHLKWKHLRPKMLCEFCGKICYHRPGLLLHQRSMHGVARDKAFLCSLCDFNAVHQQQLTDHMRGTHTKERPFSCEECGARFFTRPVLVQHMAIHKTDRPYICHICFKKCRRRNELTGHINRTHTKKYKKTKCKTKKYRYGCYLCSKMYDTHFGARQHIEKIHGLPFKNQSKLIRYDREAKDSKKESIQ